MHSFGTGFFDISCKYGLKSVLNRDISESTLFMIGYDENDIEKLESRIKIVDDVYKREFSNYILIIPVENNLLPNVNYTKHLKFQLWGMDEIMYLTEKYINKIYNSHNGYASLVYRWIWETV